MFWTIYIDFIKSPSHLESVLPFSQTCWPLRGWALALVGFWAPTSLMVGYLQKAFWCPSQWRSQQSESKMRVNTYLKFGESSSIYTGVHGPPKDNVSGCATVGTKEQSFCSPYVGVCRCTSDCECKVVAIIGKYNISDVETRIRMSKNGSDLCLALGPHQGHLRQNGSGPIEV